MTRPETETDHRTDYPVFENAEACGCEVPEDETSEAYDAWLEDHPYGESANQYDVQVCHRTCIGTYCEECSHEQGDWFKHMPICLDCEYVLETDGTCQCEPEDAES